MAASIFAWMSGVIMLWLSWKGERPTESVVMSSGMVPPLSVRYWAWSRLTAKGWAPMQT